MENEDEIVGHYGSPGLLASLMSALRDAGLDPDHLKPQDLKSVDEFHTGGAQATDHLIAQLPIPPSTRVLDIGCGIGGAARHIADSTGATVAGFDLTPEYIDVAGTLSEMTGLAQHTRFRVGSALDIPFQDNTFDLATMFHVGMNIDDKTTLFHEAARVLTPGGTFALFDVMQTRDGELNFPLPWAQTNSQSFVEPSSVYLSAAMQAGFQFVKENNRTEFAVNFFEKVFAAMNAEAPASPLGLHLLMGPSTKIKLQNYAAMINAGLIAPCEMVFRLKG